MIPIPLSAQRLELASFRCEWIYPDGQRCQNTMSLKLHHRTYDRYGAERLDDLSVFCPSHHVIADVIRKVAIGQRPEIIFERLRYVLDKKRQKIGEAIFYKFVRRLLRELELWWHESDVGDDYLQWFARKTHEAVAGAGDNHIAEVAIEFDEEDIHLLRRAVWDLKNKHLCVELPELSSIQPMLNRIESQLTANRFC